MNFAFLDVVLALAALWLLSAFFTLRCRLHAALAPLCALSLYSTALTLGGMAGALVPTAAALYAGSAALGAYALLAARRQPARAPRLCTDSPSAAARLLAPGAVVFWALTLSFAVYFAVRQPDFGAYDEYSLWGTAAKLTREQNVLFTEAKFSWPWQATQNPGLITLSYFFQFFGAFAAWKVHLAYDALLFACFAAVLGSVEWKHYALAFPAAVACWLAPFVFTIYQQQIYVSHVYMLAYGDIPAGVVFGGAVAFWLALRRDRGPFWALIPVLTLAANIKSNTFVLSLAAAGIVAADLILFAPEKPWHRGLAARIGKSAAAFAGPMLIYVLWNSLYVTALARRNAASGGLGDTARPLAEVAVNGIRMLLGLSVGSYYEARRVRYEQMLSAMADAFLHSKITMLGAGVRVVAVLFVLLAGALILLPDRRRRLRAALIWALCAVCFAAYQFMMLLSYAFIFSDATGAGLVDYNRYLYTYYLGWFLITMAIVCLAVRAAKPRMQLLGGGAVLALACGLLVLFGRYVEPELCVLGYADSEFCAAQITQAETDRAAQAIAADPARTGDAQDQRLFLVWQGDDGERWFAYSYTFLPLTLTYGDTELGGGGGTYGLPELNDGSVYFHGYTQQQLMAYLLENCDYVFVGQSDALFGQSYGSLFDDGLAAAQNGQALYRVTENGMVLTARFEVLE
jgi:hypothetical protein